MSSGSPSYLSLCWRNLLRNPRRTGLTLVSFIVGVAALTFLVAINDGWMLSMKQNFVLTQIGHVQVHAKGFEEARRAGDYIKQPDEVVRLLDAEPDIQAWTTRIRVSGLASVAGANNSASVMGVDAEREPQVSRLKAFVVAGEWLDPDDARALLLGKIMVEQLGISIGDKVVLMAQAPNGDLASEVFRLRGVLSSGAMEVDQIMALIHRDMAAKWLGLGEGVTDVVIRAKTHEAANPIAAHLAAQLSPEVYEVLRWMDIDPMIEQWTSLADAATYIILMIVVGVVLVEVLNTMLMSMHERIREFGLMEALGTRKIQMFAMMLWETVILVMSGGMGGYVLGVMIALHFGGTGIDLSAFAEAFTFIYMDPIVYPVLTVASAMKIISVTFAGALLSGLYPAWKATRLNPVAAMREV